MKRIGIFEAKTKFSALVNDAAAGNTTIITKNGKPVAAVGPAPETLDRVHVAAARLRALRKTLRDQGRLDGVNIRELIDEGRK